MNTLFRRTKASIIFLGIAMTLLGLAFFINPVDSILFVVSCCAWAFLFAGIGTLVGYFRHDPADRGAANIVLAILEIVCAIYIFFFPGWSTVALCVFLGCVIFVTGIWDVADALSFRKVEGSNWGLWLVLGIVTIVLGFLTLFAPFMMAEAIMIVAGISLVFDGITEIVLGVRM